jgi:RimJ/RimL family protein N-acetyltransferase
VSYEALSLLTERLVLRPCAPGDEAGLVAGIGDVEVQRWLEQPPHPYTFDDARDWIAHTAAEREAGRMQDFAITLTNGKLIGGVALRTPGGPPLAELGYWIARSHWGQGYATEALSRVVHFASEESTPRFTNLSALIDPANTPSRRIVERLGFVEQGSAVCGTGKVLRYQRIC